MTLRPLPLLAAALLCLCVASPARAALVLGTNCGFVTTAPTGDPDGATTLSASNRTNSWEITVPADAGSVVVSEFGIYAGTAVDPTGNYEIGIYTSDGATLVGVSRTNDAGQGPSWSVRSGLSWSVAAGTTYRIAIQTDTGGPGIDITNDANGPSHWYASTQTTLVEPCAGDATTKGFFAIYALLTPAGGGGSAVPVFLNQYRQRRNQ